MEPNNQQQPNTNTNPQPANNQPQNQQNNQQKPQQPQPQKQAPASAKPVVAANSKKNLYISGALILVVLILLTLVPYVKNKTKSGSDTKKDTTEADAGCEPGFKFNIKTGEPCPAETSDKAASATAVVSSGKTLTRADAQSKYANQMLTISGTCSVDPEELTATKGATIMLDNNTAKAHTMTVGKKSYRISPYHYTLSWLNTGDDTLKVTCDGEDAGTVTVK